MLVGSKVVKPLQNKLFNKLNTPRAVLGQKLIRVGINQLKNIFKIILNFIAHHWKGKIFLIIIYL